MDHRIKLARDHFGIQTPEDWQEIRPEWIRQVDGVGPRTLDLIRLYLAARGLTLKDDATPAFWQKNLQTATIGGQIALSDNAITTEFTILIDQQEKHPWAFQGFMRNERPLIVPHRWKSLGPSHGDYSVAGCEGIVHVERKSIGDALGTFLSHGDRRDRWINTLEFLAEIDHGDVVIEGTVGQCLAAIVSRGSRSRTALCREFLGSVRSWSHRYSLNFWFLDDRRMAEGFAFGLLERGWKYATEMKSHKPTDNDAAVASIS